MDDRRLSVDRLPVADLRAQSPIRNPAITESAIGNRQSAIDSLTAPMSASSACGSFSDALA
jgi:hypothetical protein